MMTSTITPAPVVKKRNTFSRPNRRRDGSPPPPPSGGGATASPVVAGTRLLGAGDRLAGRVTGQLDELPGAVADLGHLQAGRLGERPLDVPDAAIGLVHRRRDAVRALLAVAAGRLPGLVVAVGPV